MKYRFPSLNLIPKNSIIFKFISSASEKYITALISITATLLLTYIYGLELVGFIGTFSIFIALGHVFSDGGIGQIILRHEASPSALSALLLTNIFIGSLIFFIFLSLGSFFSDLANVKNFDEVFKFYISIIIFNAVSMVPVALITKKGNYKILNFANLLAMILSLGIVLFTVDKQNFYWASLYFVYYYGLRAIFLFFYVHKLIYKKPNFDDAKQYIRFGAYVFGANTLKTTSENTLSFLLPSLIGLQYAGYYGLLVKGRELVVGALSHAIHRVIYVERTKGNYSNFYARNSAFLLTVIACFFWICLAFFIDDFLFYFGATSLNNPDLTLNIFLFLLLTSLCLPGYNIFTQMIQYSDVRFFSIIENSFAISFLFFAFSFRDTPIFLFQGLSLVVIIFLIISILKFESTYKSRLITLPLFLIFISVSYFLIWWLLK